MSEAKFNNFDRSSSHLGRIVVYLPWNNLFIAKRIIIAAVWKVFFLKKILATQLSLLGFRIFMVLIIFLVDIIVLGGLVGSCKLCFKCYMIICLVELCAQILEIWSVLQLGDDTF